VTTRHCPPRIILLLRQSLRGDKDFRTAQKCLVYFHPILLQVVGVPEFQKFRVKDSPKLYSTMFLTPQEGFDPSPSRSPGGGSLRGDTQCSTNLPRDTQCSTTLRGIPNPQIFIFLDRCENVPIKSISVRMISLFLSLKKKSGATIWHTFLNSPCVSNLLPMDIVDNVIDRFAEHRFTWLCGSTIDEPSFDESAKERSVFCGFFFCLLFLFPVLYHP